MSLQTNVANVPVYPDATTNSSALFSSSRSTIQVDDLRILSIVHQTIQSAKELFNLEAMQNPHEKDQTFRIEYYNKSEMVYSAHIEPINDEFLNGEKGLLNRVTYKPTGSSTPREDAINKERVRFFDLIQTLCDLHKTKSQATTTTTTTNPANPAFSNQYDLFEQMQKSNFPFWTSIFNSFRFCREHYQPGMQMWENVALSTALASFSTLSNYYQMLPTWILDDNALDSDKVAHAKHVEWLNQTHNFLNEYQNIRNAFANFHPNENLQSELSIIQKVWHDFVMKAVLIGKMVKDVYPEKRENRQIFINLKRPGERLEKDLQ